ncbi:MAG: hypothetical protein ABIK75_06845 [candidate division WOR-3 bacterium]
MRWGLIFLTLFTQIFSRWTIPINISNNYYSSFLSVNNTTNLIIDNNANIHFIWYDYTPYLNYPTPQIYYKFYSPKTGFSDNYCVSDKENEIAYYPAIALDSSNNLHLIYVSKNNYYYLRYKIKSASRWTESEVIDSSPNFIYPPSIAIFPDGRIGITYCKIYNSFYQVFYKEKNESGWQPTIMLTTSNFHKYYPAIAIDQNNNVHIVWEGREQGISNDQIFYRKRNNNNNWEEVILISENFSRAQYNPTIIADKENNIHIAWYGYHPERSIYYRIYYRYKSNNGNWENVDTIAGANEDFNRYRFYPFFTFDNNNRIYLVWFGQENISYYKIWLRVKENGVWQEKIQIPDNYPNGSVYYPKIFGINSNYLHLVFYDYRMSNSEIFYITTQPYDIGINKIISPKRYNIKGIITPQIEVKNNFNTYHTFKAFCEIFDNNNQRIYVDSQFKSIGGLDSINVSFKEYNFQNEGDYLITFSLNLIDDTIRENDTLSKIFTIGKVDIILKEIVSPKGVILFDTSQKIIPQLKIINNGEINISFYLYFQIKKNNQILYYDSSYVSNISPNEEKVIQFPSLSINDSGNFRTYGFVNLDGDVNPINNNIKNQFFILNKGSQYWHLLRDMPSLPSQKKVGKGSAMAVAFDTLIFALKGNNTPDFYCYNINTGFWEILNPIPYLPTKSKNVKDGGSIVFDGERYLYIIKGNNTKEFWRYDIFNKNFEILPEIIGDKNVKKGADLTFYNGKIYLLKGNNTKEILVFDTATKVWSSLKQPPAKKGFKEGSSLITCESIPAIYLLQATTNLFFRYLIEKDTWESLPPLPFEHPVEKKKKKVRDGGCLAIKDNIIYAIKGGSTREFWCFNPYTNKWLPLETIPKGPYQKDSKSGTIVANSFGIFLLKGKNENEFWVWIGLPNLDSTFALRKQETRNIQSENLSNLTKKNYIIYDITGRKIKNSKKIKRGIYFIKREKKFVIIK